MLRFPEEILLLIFNNERGDFVPPRAHSLDIILAGAVLMDLAMEDRIDTNIQRLILINPASVGDDLLDPTLADIAQSTAGHDISYWLTQTAKRSEEIRQKALARLVERGILESEDNGLFSLSSSVSRSRRYPTRDGSTVEEVQTRIMRVLFSGDIPDPHDIMLISLTAASGAFGVILSREELAEVQERIELVQQLDMIGRSVAKALQDFEYPAPSAPPRSFQEIPHARGWSLVGNAFAMAGDIRAFFAKQYVELGPIFRVRAFNRRFTVLAGPKANRFMAHMGKTYLRSYEFWRDFNPEVGAMRSLISMDSIDHLRLRKVQVAGYSRKRIGSQLAEAVSIARGEIAAWPQNQAITAQYTFQRIIVEQLGVIITGVSSREYIDDLIVFVETLLATRLTHHYPKLMMNRPRVKRARKRVHELYLKVLAAHEPAKRRNKRPDMIDDLLELHRTDPQFLSEKDLKISVLGPFIAGLDTAASICAFMLYELLKNPDLLVRMTAEADALFGDGMPTAERLKQLDVTHRIAMETLRMYPVAPAQTRMVANSFEFEGYEIPAGEWVIVGTSVPHCLPQYFPDPERFDIERYTTQRAEHRKSGVYAPFGMGVHRCLGGGFAEVLIAITLATIAYETELALDPPGYKLKINNVPNPHPKNSFKFRMVRRRQ